MLVGIGTDIVEVERIAKVFKRQGEAFARKLLSEPEWIEFEQHKFPERFLAKRWAIKEAVSKALGTGISQGVCFTEMTVSHTELGQPILTLLGRTQQKSTQLNITHWAISVSDEKTHTVAFAIAEKRGQHE